MIKSFLSVAAASALVVPSASAGVYLNAESTSVALIAPAVG